MKLKDRARLIWRNIEAFAYALDYDPHADTSLRIERLELDGQLLRTQLTILSEEVLKLSQIQKS